MRKVALIVAAVAAVLFGGWVWYAQPDHHYRLTIEVETPDGMKSASSVLAMYLHDATWGLPEARGLRAALKGDAVFLDLGHGRNVVALLAHGPKAENVVKMLGLDAASFARAGQQSEWYEIKDLKGIAAVPADLIPTLVTIPDVNDPESTRVIAPDDFASVFGPGYRFKGATVEIVRGPRTRGIAQRIPFLATHREALRHSRPMMMNDPYILHLSQFEIGR